MIQNSMKVVMAILMLVLVLFIPDNSIWKGIGAIIFLVYIFIPQSVWDKIDKPSPVDYSDKSK